MAPDDTTMTSVPRARNAGDILGDSGQPGRARAGRVLVHDQRAADLDDHAAGGGERWRHAAAFCRVSWMMFCNARNTSGTPWPVTPDSSITGRPEALRNAAAREEISRGVIASILFRPISSRFFRETAAIRREFVAHRSPCPDHVTRGAVNEVQHDRATLDMAEEAVTEAGALMRALDQAGDVGEHEFLGHRQPDDAELGMQGGERVIRDLRVGRGGGGEKGRLPGIRQSNQSGVGDQLQAQPDPALLARPAFGRLARRPVGRGLVMRVTEAAIATAQQRHALTRPIEIGQHRLLVFGEDLGADRNLDHHV